MSIKVKFFARMRDAAGMGSSEVDFVDGMTAADAWARATNGAEFPESIMIAVNMEYVSGEPVLKDGDELAFFPQVTGG